MGSGKRFYLITPALLLALLFAPAAAQSVPPRESQVKAAMLCNFVQFVEWPADAFASGNSPLVIGVMNPNPFGDIPEELVKGKTVSGHAIVIQHYDSADDIQRCQALFVPASRNGDLDAIMHKLGDQPVLTVGETDAFPWAGGVMRFYLEGNKIRFEVSPDAAAHARLQISSKLMKLATIFKR